MVVLLLGYPWLGKCNGDDIVKQIWSSESEDGSLEWYDGPKPIEYPFSPQPNTTMTSIDDEAAITTIYVDPSRAYQTFLGFGESFEGSTIYNLSRMSPVTRTQILERLIDPDAGAGFNLFRICIGTSDFTPTEWGWYSLDDPPNGEPDPNLEYFSIEKDVSNSIISVLQEALQIADNKGVNLRLIASPWSPPGWMKTGNSMIGGKLKEEYNQVYARYLYEFLKAYKEQGIPIYAITVQNEPGWVTTTPGTCMPPDQQAAIIKELRKLIDADPEIDTKILAHDWNFDDTPRPPDDCFLDEYTHIQLAKDALTFLNPPGNYVYGVAFHSYDWANHDEDNIAELYRLYPNLKMFHTERAEWGTDGMNRIVRLFRHRISTYVGWVTVLDNDIVDDGNEDEQFPGTPTPPSIVCDASEPDNCWMTPTYYLKQQFSKFIQPGAVRIHSNAGASQLSNVAFLNPDNTIVVIVVNQSADSREFRVRTDTEQFTAIIPGKVVASYQWNAQSIPCPRRNLAAGRPVIVSSTENITNTAANAVDGDPDTRWASQWTDNEWIYVDLGRRYKIDRVVLDWEDAYGKKYDVQISDDASTWTTIAHEDNGFIGVNIHDVTATGRYVKMKGIKRGTGYGYSLYEFEVYGEGGCTYLPIIMRQYELNILLVLHDRLPLLAFHLAGSTQKLRPVVNRLC